MEKMEECPRCGHDGHDWNYDGQRCSRCTWPLPTLQDALIVLNKAAHAAIRAGADTTAHPFLDRQALREIVRATDKLVIDNARRIGQ